MRRPIVTFKTHGLNWRQVLRDSHIFVAQVEPGWATNPLTQRQYAYARELGKPIYLLVQEGTPLPPHADDYVWRIWSTVEELADLMLQITEGKV